MIRNGNWTSRGTRMLVGLIVWLGLITIGSWGGAQEASVPEKAKLEHRGSATDSEDRYQVPDGDIAALEAFIDRIRAYKPVDTMDLLRHERKAPKALQAAARKVLAQQPGAQTTAREKAEEILLEQRIQTAGSASPKECRTIYRDLLKFLKKKKVAGDAMPAKYFSWALIVANVLDTEAPDLAAEAYRRFGELFQGSPDREVAEMANLFLGAARRLQLPGNRMELRGTQVDGRSFDLARLKGHVVLIDFWATWCGPCVAEHDKLIALYRRYHDRGFEIVGISLDVDRQRLENYLQRKSIPWITLFEEGKKQNPAYEKYGILSIPVLILVGRDGKVISVDARGEELDHLLARQFPEPDGESR